MHDRGRGRLAGAMCGSLGSIMGAAGVRVSQRGGMRTSRAVVGALLFAALASLASVRPAPSQAQELRDLPLVSVVPVDTLRLPSAGLRGIAFGDSVAFLLMSSNTDLSIPEGDYRASILRWRYRSGRADTLLTERGAFEAGLATDGGRFFAGGNGVGGQEALFVLERPRVRIASTLPAAGYHPGGLVWDDEYLWQVDADARQFARIEPEEGKVSRRFAAPGFYPTGLAYDGFHFWNADAATGRLYRVKAFNGKADAVVDEQFFSRPGEFVTLGWDGRRLWVASARDAYVVRYEILR